MEGFDRKAGLPYKAELGVDLKEALANVMTAFGPVKAVVIPLFDKKQGFNGPALVQFATSQAAVRPVLVDAAA